MTPRASVAAWQRPAKRSRLGRVGARRLRRGCSAVVGAVPGGLRVSVVGAGGRARGESAHDRALRVLLRASRATCGSGWSSRRPPASRWSASPRCIALWPKARALHGDARFASRREIRRAGLFASDGLFLGRVGRRYLMLGGQQGASSAPPRAARARRSSSRMPDLAGLAHLPRHQARELDLTAGFRARSGQECFLFDPLDDQGRTACLNPLSYVSPRSEPARQRSAAHRRDALSGIRRTDPFWTAGGARLFLGIALYLFETPSLPPTLGEVLRQGMASDDEGFGEHWKRVIEGRQSGSFPLSPQCVRALYDIMDLAPVTASSSARHSPVASICG